jgi:predicted membrane metal-binding protein
MVLVLIIQQPYVQLVLMIVTFILHFVWIIWSKQYNEEYKFVYYMKLIELASFIAI